jgi:hypothetical protein
MCGGETWAGCWEMATSIISALQFRPRVRGESDLTCMRFWLGSAQCRTRPGLSFCTVRSEWSLCGRSCLVPAGGCQAARVRLAEPWRGQNFSVRQARQGPHQ